MATLPQVYCSKMALVAGQEQAYEFYVLVDAEGADGTKVSTRQYQAKNVTLSQLDKVAGDVASKRALILALPA